MLDPSDTLSLAATAFENRPAKAERAAMLEAMAGTLDARRGEIIALCAEETALTPEELAPEFDRMTGTLRIFAAVVREGKWVRTSIDRPSANHIGPNHDVRKMLIPLGPVAVFGSSNFPLAYGVCGGDTASALAAGCPVIVKEHPAHPRTGRLLAEIARGATEQVWSDAHAYLRNEDPEDYSIAQQLVQAPEIAAVGFTGSVKGGLAIDKLASERERPIPVFAEMGSSNIVLVTRQAAAERCEKIAQELAASILARYGQQCTNTGVLLFDEPGASNSPLTPEEILEGLTAQASGPTPDSRTLDALKAKCKRAPNRIIDALKAALLSAPQRRMLSARVSSAYTDRLEDFAAGYESEAVVHRPGLASPTNSATPALIETDWSELTYAGRYRDEIFGPACIAVRIDLDHSDSVNAVLFGLNGDQCWGQLVASVYVAEPLRDADRRVIALLQRTAGRLVFNGVPTGVRVCESMVHGGPYPATNAPHTTAVGPLAIERWCRPVCFQNCPQALLPEELRDP